MGLWRLIALFGLAGSALAGAPVLADPVTVYGTRAGEVAYDADPFGGNPFASAVVLALSDQGEDGAFAIEVNTGELSGGYQIADASQLGDLTLRLAPGEDAVALVVVFADYGDVAGLPSLPGAAFDAVRVANALRGAGYTVAMAVPRTAAEYRAALAEFAGASANYERALIYTTGHGIEPDGYAFLLPPDVDAQANPGPGDAIGLDEVGQNLKASATNLLLYAGCRENLMPHEAAQAVRTRRLR
ncbi:MAG: caspase family protein [Sphingomonadaceae bacterium]